LEQRTPQAVDDVLTGGAYASGQSCAVGTLEGLLSNDRGSKNFVGLVGADENAVLLIEGGAIEVKGGNIVFTTNASFTGGVVKFDYLWDYPDSVDSRQGSTGVSVRVLMDTCS
jgi:hypothetical protein